MMQPLQIRNSFALSRTSLPQPGAWTNPSWLVVSNAPFSISISLCGIINPLDSYFCSWVYSKRPPKCIRTDPKHTIFMDVVDLHGIWMKLVDLDSNFHFMDLKMISWLYFDIWMVLARSIRRTTSSSTWSHPAGWIDSFRASGCQGGPMVTDSNPKRRERRFIMIYHDLSLF